MIFCLINNGGVCSKNPGLDITQIALFCSLKSLSTWFFATLPHITFQKDKYGGVNAYQTCLRLNAELLNNILYKIPINLDNLYHT